MMKVRRLLGLLLVSGMVSFASPADAAPEGIAAPATAIKRPKIKGVKKYDKVLKVTPGKWSESGLKFRYRWLRDGVKIKGKKARVKRRVTTPEDVGHRLRVQVRAYRGGVLQASVLSKRIRKIRHVRPVRKTVSYRIARDGKTSASLKKFRRQVAETLSDPRGWRAAGIRFKEVKKGGSFTVVLTEAARVPRYSSGCSSVWSCRVGNNVLINQTRWAEATPAWNRADRSLRDYRHMVVNHEVGHWLGKYHDYCSGKGHAAPIMMQQSKGFNGCKPNPWPRRQDLSIPRFRYPAPSTR